MATEYSISVSDWNYESWEFLGRQLEEQRKGEWSEDNQDGISNDDFIPMVLYAYPLYRCPSDSQIFEIHEKTYLTVVQNIESEEHYLALCGDGMDFSQDVGMAYIIAEGSIPYALATQISTQPNVSQKGENFRQVIGECQKTISYTRQMQSTHCKKSTKQSSKAKPWTSTR